MTKSLFLGLLLICLGTLAGAEERSLEGANGEVIRYRVLREGETSARPVAERILKHLSAGEIEDAALLSTSPRRRYEVLSSYRDAVGDNEFRRIFSQYLSPANGVVAEVAIDAHRLLVFRLGEAKDHPAAQYFVEIDGKFLMDDMPNETRLQLRRVLNAYRAGKIRL